MKLSRETINNIYNYFEDYKNNMCLTTEDIAKVFGINRTTVGNHLKNRFGEEYTNVSKSKINYNHKLTEEQRLKISKALKGKPKPKRSLQHRLNLSKAMSKTYVERFGEERAKIISKKIRDSNKGKKKVFKNKELWRENLSNSLKGRNVWNKGKKGITKAWNKKDLPSNEIIEMYTNQDLSCIKIAKKFNVVRSVILRILKENNVKIKGYRGFAKGKKLVDILGKEKAELKIKKFSEKIKGRKNDWGYKISKSLKKFYQENEYPEKKKKQIGDIHRRLWQNKDYKNKLIQKHKEYIKNNPQELERLKEIQYPGKSTKIEIRFLNFLKESFIENKDFFFDKYDKTKRTYYRPDFQFPSKKIIIELDGYYKHFTKEGMEKDKVRQKELENVGWKVYRFNYLDVDRNYLFEKTKDKIMEIFKDD